MDSNETIIERLKHIMASRRLTQVQMARMLETDPGNLSKYLSGRLPVSQSLINRVVVNMGVSKEWLCNGSDVPYPKPSHAVAIESGHKADIRAGGGVPIYDVDVTAGYGPLDRMLTVDRIIGSVNLPQLPPDCSLVRVSGDSMTPRVPDGAYIAVRPLSDISTIFWGQIYVIVMDEYRMVKIMRRHTDPARVILHSVNPDYDDMEVRRSDIRAIYIVEAIINYSLMN